MAKRKKTPEPDPSLELAMAREADRGCVMVGAAFAEYRLEELLRAKISSFPDVDRELMNRAIGGPDESQALLYSGWSKAVAMHLLGGMPKSTFMLYNAIRKLRNEFAHRAGEVKLDDEAISGILKALDSVSPGQLAHSLDAADKSMMTPPPRGYGRLREVMPGVKFSRPRVLFMSSCMILDRELIKELWVLQNYDIAYRKVELTEDRINSVPIRSR